MLFFNKSAVFANRKVNRLVCWHIKERKLVFMVLKSVLIKPVLSCLSECKKHRSIKYYINNVLQDLCKSGTILLTS